MCLLKLLPVAGPTTVYQTPTEWHSPNGLCPDTPSSLCFLVRVEHKVRALFYRLPSCLLPSLICYLLFPGSYYGTNDE